MSNYGAHLCHDPSTLAARRNLRNSSSDVNSTTLNAAPDSGAALK